MHRFPCRTQSRAAIAACCAALLWGCGEEDEGVPTPCTEGDQALVRALRAAPGPVQVGSGRLSDCLSKGADGDQLQLVGTSFVEAASGLAARAPRR